MMIFDSLKTEVKTSEKNGGQTQEDWHQSDQEHIQQVMNQERSEDFVDTKIVLQD